MGAEVEINPVGFEVLRQKHNNGKVDEIHKQMFVDLKKEKCMVCDLPAILYFQLQKQMAYYAAKIDLKHSVAEKFNGIDSRYDPKKAPAGIELTCVECGNKNKVGYSRVYGPEYQRLDTEQFKCSSCWWKDTGSKI